MLQRGDASGSRIGWADKLLIRRPPILVAMLVAILAVPVLSWPCLVLSMWPSHPPKPKKCEKPVENGLCGVSCRGRFRPLASLGCRTEKVRSGAGHRGMPV